MSSSRIAERQLICEFYSVSLSQGAVLVPTFGWRLLSVSTH